MRPGIISDGNGIKRRSLLRESRGEETIIIDTVITSERLCARFDLTLRKVMDSFGEMFELVFPANSANVPFLK